LDADKDVRGGIAGSFPIDGDYGAFEYLSWAAKFFIDANMLERRIATHEHSPGQSPEQLEGRHRALEMRRLRLP
jgi:hypothetical protein